MTADGVSALGRRVLAAGTVSVLLFVLVGAVGESAAAPPLGPRTWFPPWDAGLGVPPAVIGIALVVAYLLGAAAVWWGLDAVAAGLRPDPRRVALLAVVAVVALLLVPPFGSADHLSYAAYGRIAAQGGDPYAIAPNVWHGGHDVVAGAAEPPWDDTTSVYGPVATALQAVASLAGGDSVRATVSAWQLLVGAAFLLTGWLLDRLARRDPARRARVAVLWTLNPVLLGVLVGGAHLDAISVAAAIGCLALGIAAARPDRPPPLAFALTLGAGVALGLAAGTKLPYAAAGLAVLWLHRRRPAIAVGGLVAGAAAVLLPAHLWAGPHVYDQASEQSRFVSLATPWRAVTNALAAAGYDDARSAVVPAFAVLACLVLVAVLPRMRAADGDDGSRAMLALAVAYLVSAPYVLPWYDALLWAPLALVAGTGLDRVLLLRFGTLAIAYVPGRAAGPPSTLTDIMLDFREFAAPLVTGAVLVWIIATGLRRNTTVSPTRASPRKTIAETMTQSGVDHSHDH